MPDKVKTPIDFDKFVFDARPDTLDFRDRMYEPSLVEVPTHIALSSYKRHHVPILNQGLEGACTGFGLATVANYLLRRRKVVPDSTPISPRMLYEMAKRYDEWPGEDYRGSSARGAMKGWHKHGVCANEKWPYDPNQPDTALTHARITDAATRPLGAYYRVNHKDLVAMHSALAEVGILFASAWVHSGWVAPDEDGRIPYEKSYTLMGGHAFALVGYDERGFWLQNSWGPDWGAGGFARLSYDDWLANGADVWVARLGVPVSLRIAESTAVTIAPGATQTKSYSFAELHPHIISLRGNGSLNTEGTYGNSEADVIEIFQSEIPRQTASWEKKRLVLYAHGGLVDATTFIQRVAEYRAAFLQAEVYPLSFLWFTGFWGIVTTILQEALRRRRPDGAMNERLDFMLDRLDDTLEPLVRSLTGRVQWQELKQRAYHPTLSPDGGARLALKYLAQWMASQPQAEVHLVAHSAGSIFLAPLVRLLTTSGKIKSGLLRGEQGLGIPVSSCTLWAPAMRVDEFKRTFLPAIQSGGIQRFSLYALDDQSEQDDHVAQIYNKSLLYLISNALEDAYRQPILGLDYCLRRDQKLAAIFEKENVEWVRAPNNAPRASRWASTARHHSEFDDDALTLRSTLSRIVGLWEDLPEFDFQRSESSLREKRIHLEDMID
ncbi:MAG: C1 family peptidase [Chloroflexota bacterium]